MAEDKDKTTPANLPPVTYAPRPPRLRRPPFLMVSIGLVSIVASWVPLVIFARARTIPSSEPRVQLMQDMGVQPKFSQQQKNELFADSRADRLPIPGTVARGDLQDDDHYYRGYSRVGGTAAAPKVEFFDTFPESVTVDASLLKRGQERFNIYCSACHGYDGHGHGAVNEQALELMAQHDSGTTWTQAADLTTGVPTKRPVGHIYNTINVGIRTMPSYGAQVPAADRWAIVAYVRALQFSENAPADLPVKKPGDGKGP
jgi:mono/diheme cytochrome c family protein